MIFQSLKWYDSHLVIKQAFDINNRIGSRNIDAIRKSYAKIMTFPVGDLKFIEPSQFVASSLETTCRNLHEERKKDQTDEEYDKYTNFKCMQQN